MLNATQHKNCPNCIKIIINLSYFSEDELVYQGEFGEPQIVCGAEIMNSNIINEAIL